MKGYFFLLTLSKATNFNKFGAKQIFPFIPLLKKVSTNEFFLLEKRYELLRGKQKKGEICFLEFFLLLSFF
jgi:hypothetical protein